MPHRRVTFVLLVLAALMLAFGFHSSRAQSTLPPAQEERLELLRASLNQGLPENLLDPALSEPAFERGQRDQEISALNLPAWYQIVFQVPGRETWDLYLMNGQSSEIRPFMDGNENDMYPAFAYTGERVFLAREVSENEFDLHSYTVDQSAFVRLTDAPGNDLDPQPSPDGARIIFQSNRDGNPEIYVMDADGSNPRRLTEHPGYDGEPTWSPDGAQVAFISDRGGVYDLWVIDTDGGNLRQLTSGAYAFTPAWSPQGATIAVSLDSNLDGFLELWLVGAEGDGKSKLLEDVTQSYSSDFWKPSWSPDGKTILLIETGWAYNYNYETWFINSSGIFLYDMKIPYQYSGSFGYELFVWEVDIVSPDSIAPGPCRIIDDDPGSVAGDGALFRMQADDSGYIGAVAYQVQARIDAYRAWEDLYPYQPYPGGLITGANYASQELRCRAVDSGGNWGPWSQPPYTRLEYDAAPPISSVVLGEIDPQAAQARLEIRASDIGVGIASVDLYARTSDAGSVWELYEEDMQPGDEILFPILAGVTYEVRSSAQDLAGNYEIWSPTPDVVFTIEPPSSVVDLSPAGGEKTQENIHTFLPLIQQKRNSQVYGELRNHWPTYAHNNSRNSFNASEPGASDYALAWSYTERDCNHVYLPSVSGGVLSYSLYCGGAPARLMARDSRSGELLWQQDGPIDDTYGGYFDGTLKYGRVFLNYTGYNTDSFKATNLRTGDVIWEQPLWENDSAFSYAPLVFQDSMFSFPMNRFLAAYDVASGAEKWMSRIAAGNYKTSALSFDPADGKLRLVNLLYDSQPFTFLKTGFLDWDFGRENMQQYFRTTPVIAGNVALFQTDYDLLAVDLTTHQELWNVEGYNGYDSGNHPAVDGHEVYAIVDDDLKVFDLSDGSLLWEYIVPEAFQYSPVLTQHYVYVQSLTKIYILDRRTHEMVQTLDGDGRFVVADGHLYHLLSSASGAIIRIYRAENP